MVLVFVCVHMLSLSCVQLFAAAWTVAHQVLLPMEFFKQEYWCGVCYHFLLQGFFPTQGLNLCLVHWWADSLPLNHLGSPQAFGIIAKNSAQPSHKDFSYFFSLKLLSLFILCLR